MAKATQIQVVSPLGFQIWRIQRVGAPMPMAHTHADIEINYLTSGWIRYFHGGRFYDVASNRLAVFWAGIPHQLVAQSRTIEGIWITFPVNWLLGWQVPGSLQDGMLSGELVIEDNESSYEARSDRERLESWLSAYSANRSEQHTI